MKAKRTAIVMIRMVPEEKKAAYELADQLGVSASDVIRLALHELLQRNNIQYPSFQVPTQPQIIGERRLASTNNTDQHNT